jgi:hypothetical protein
MCDEVDAALDVGRAAHLAAYISRSSTQFLVISHKPQARACMLLRTPSLESPQTPNRVCIAKKIFQSAHVTYVVYS